jgi:hypothetical protein
MIARDNTGQVSNDLSAYTSVLPAFAKAANPASEPHPWGDQARQEVGPVIHGFPLISKDMTGPDQARLVTVHRPSAYEVISWAPSRGRSVDRFARIELVGNRRLAAIWMALALAASDLVSQQPLISPIPLAACLRSPVDGSPCAATIGRASSRGEDHRRPSYACSSSKASS